MKLYKYSLLLLLSLFVFSCYEDNSAIADKEINSINIASVQKDSIYLFLGDQIEIQPKIDTKSSTMTYSWSIGIYSVNAVDKVTITTNLKEVSTERDLVYRPEKLGHYYLRLIVTNEHGSAIKYYHVFINAEYEEGFLILGKRSDGANNISFMRTLNPSEIAAGKKPEFKQNTFAYTNEGRIIDGNAIDIEKIGSSIYILCADAKKVMRINAKTFQLEYEYDLSILTNDIKPINMNGYDSNYCREIYVPTAGGGVAKVVISDFEVFWDVAHPRTAKMVTSIDRYNYSSSKKIINIDTDKNIWIEGFHAPTMGFTIFSIDWFKDRDIIGMFIDGDGNFITFNRKGSDYYVTKLGGYGYSFETMEIDIIYDNVLNKNTNIITENSKFHHNDTYSCVFFSGNRGVYKWHYNQNQIPGEPFITVPDGEKIVQITSYPYDKGALAPSGDESEIHVLTYNADRKPLSGSLYRYSVVDGKLIEKYEGVSDEPIKSFYKIK